MLKNPHRPSVVCIIMLRTTARIVEPEDGGAIAVESVTSNGASFAAQLRLKPEACLEPGPGFEFNGGLAFKQWFFFEAQGLPVGPGTVATFTIADAGESTFSDWRGYKVGEERHHP
jgi:hypothetical protein